jgi:hypothetical protein
VIRSFGAVVASMVVAYLVTILGAYFLPSPAPLTEATLREAARESDDFARVTRLLEESALPGRVLTFVVFPLASIALGATATLLSRDRQWLPTAGVAATLLWSAFFLCGAYIWSDPPDPPDLYDLQVGASYVVVAMCSAWVVSGLRSRLSRGAY